MAVSLTMQLARLFVAMPPHSYHTVHLKHSGSTTVWVTIDNEMREWEWYWNPTTEYLDFFIQEPIR